MDRRWWWKFSGVLVICLLWQSSILGGTRRLAITLDDLPATKGANSDLGTVRKFNRKILTALKKHEAPAIGFVNESRLHVPGELDERIAILQMWLDADMQLGNHTYSHPDLNTSSLREYQDDVLHGEVITRRLLQARGEKMEFFRFPFNHRGTDAATRDAFDLFLHERGYRVAPFTVEHVDYAFNAVYVAARKGGDQKMMVKVRGAYLDFLDTVFDYFERFSVDLWEREIAQVFLIHVNEINAECMDEMLQRLEKRGYSFISLETALEDDAYQAPDNYLGRFGPSWMHRWTLSRGLPMRRDEPDPPAFLWDAYQGLRTGG